MQLAAPRPTVQGAVTFSTAVFTLTCYWLLLPLWAQGSTPIVCCSSARELSAYPVHFKKLGSVPLSTLLAMLPNLVALRPFSLLCA